MEISHKFDYASLHTHINLLGWASLALAGFVYHIFPDAARSRLANFHFWLHNIGLPVMMIGLFFYISGNAAFESVVAVGGVLTVVGIILFMINVLMNVNLRRTTI